MESAAACRVIYIDDRFPSERWLSRDGLSTPVTPQKRQSDDLHELPPELQANVSAILSFFHQGMPVTPLIFPSPPKKVADLVRAAVYVCNSGRLFSSKLSEVYESVKDDCTPIVAFFDVGSEKNHHIRQRLQHLDSSSESPVPSPTLRRQITFSAESDESYGLQLLSRIAADLQVEEGQKLIIPVAIVQPKRKDSEATIAGNHTSPGGFYARHAQSLRFEDTSHTIDSQIMLHCLDAGAVDVVQSPLDRATIMGLTVHCYRIYKAAKKEQAGFLARAGNRRKQSWVGVEEEEKPYAYLREAMVRKLLKGICEPETVIEDYQHRGLHVLEYRKAVIARQVGEWSFCGHDFSEDELVYAGYCMLDHALQLPELERWRMSQGNRHLSSLPKALLTSFRL